jgi:succinate-semialdehyde dehydrogenase/glutarate-semialdehyde dehydrogenase
MPSAPADTAPPTGVIAPNQLFISGDWRDASDAATFEVVDPATERVVDRVASATSADVDAALNAALLGFEEWRTASAWARSAVLRRGAQLLADRIGPLAAVLTEEQGKTLEESTAELTAAAEHLDWYADEARRIYGRVVDGHSREVRLTVMRQPVGPVAAFTAWNFPALLPMRKIAPALAAGCSIVLKPAEEAPRTALALAQVLQEAGLPDGVLNMVTGDPAPIARQLLASPVIRKVTLTGSVAVGRELLRLAADDVKDTTMELGGHAPVLVMADAELPAAADAIVRGKFRNGGQVCIAPSRFYVDAAVAAPLLELVLERVGRLRVGAGSAEGVDVGPLVNARRLAAVGDLVEDAVASGADLLSGGERPRDLDSGYFYEPTVLGNVPDTARTMIEEPFGPIAPFTTFDTVEEALRRANATPYGLAGYVFTSGLRTAHVVAEELEVGMVGINHLLLATAESPFGGVKRSGFGREGGVEGTEAYTITKSVSVRP